MKPPHHTKATGRKRRTLGWTLLTLGLLVAAVWVASGWWRVSWWDAQWRLTVQRGQVFVERADYALNPAGVRATFIADELEGLYSWSAAPLLQTTPPFAMRGWHAWALSYSCQYVIATGGPTYERWSVAYWSIPLLLWTPAALLLRSGILARRRANTSACLKCGYSHAGLAADAPCPECGKGAKVAT